METKNKKGIVVISVDVESAEDIKPSHQALFNIFDSWGIPITWALVSSLYEQKGHALISCIKKSGVKHEIASHSFRHDDISKFGSPEEYAKQLSAIRELEEKNNLRPAVSYVFPRNRIGFIDKLRDNGWEIYRKGTTIGSYRLGSGMIGKTARFLEYILCLAPPVFNLRKDPFGMIVTEGSMCIIDACGICGFIPCKCRENRAIKGIERAIKERKILHLWFHDYVISCKSNKMIATLKRIAQYLNKKREEGKIDILTMRELTNE